MATNIKKIILSVSLILAAVTVPAAAASDPYVLFVGVDYHHGYPETLFASDLERRLPQGVKLERAFFDMSDVVPPDSSDAVVGRMRGMCSDRKPDALVIYGTGTLLTFASLFDDVWKDVPAVVVSRNRMIPQSLSLIREQGDSVFLKEKDNMVSVEDYIRHYDATAVYCDSYMYETVKLMFTLFPEKENVVLLTDGLFEKAVMPEKFKTVMKTKYPEKRFEIISSRDYGIARMLDKVYSLDSSSVILYDSFNVNDCPVDAFRHLRFEDAVEVASVIPVFVTADLGAKEGETVGGCYIPFQSVCDEVAANLERILSGTSASSIPSKTAGFPKDVLDHTVLSRFDILDKVPANSLVLFAPPSFFARNILSFVVTLVFLLVLALICLIFKKKKSSLESSLAEEAELNRRILSAFDGSFYILDDDGNFVKRLSAFSFGIVGEGEDITQRNFRDFIKSPETMALMDRAFRKAVNDGTTENATISPDKEGKDKWLQVKFFQYKKGYVMGFVSDITSSVQKETRQQDYQRMIETLLDNVPVAVTMKDVESGRYSVWNRYAEMYWQISASEAIGRSAEDCFSAESAEKINAYDTIARSGGRVINEIASFEVGGTLSYGLISTRMLNYPINDEKWIISSLIDITAIKENERTIDKLNREYTLVKQVLHLATWNWDVKNDVLALNLNYFTTREGTGEDDKYVVNTSMARYFGNIVEEDSLIFRTNIKKLKDGELDSFHCEYRVRSLLTDRIIWVESFAIVAGRDERGLPLSATGVSIDIASRKAEEAAIVEAKRKAEEASDLKTSFLANVSHKIRTPLNSILGFSNLLVDTEDPDDKRSYADIIKRNNSLLLKYVDGILDMSGIESGTLRFTYKDTDINQVIRDVAESFRFRAAESGLVEIREETPLQECLISTDRPRLEQVLFCLMDNAFKNTVKGSITLGYQIEGEGARICFFCKDTGCGMSADDLKSVLGSTDKSGRFLRGRGVGLSISEMIVRGMNGSMDAESVEGEGSSFRVLLPIVQPGCSPASGGEEETEEIGLGAVTADQSSSIRKKVLVAEDNDSDYRLIKAVLGRRCDILHASNGKEAVEMVLSGKPDLVLMDIKMPVTDGYEATTSIKRKNPDLPVVAVTAYATKEDVERINGYGFDGFLAKPVDFNKLRHTVYNLLYSARPAK